MMLAALHGSSQRCLLLKPILWNELSGAFMSAAIAPRLLEEVTGEARMTREGALQRPARRQSARSRSHFNRRSAFRPRAPRKEVLFEEGSARTMLDFEHGSYSSLPGSGRFDLRLCGRRLRLRRRGGGPAPCLCLWLRANVL